MNSINTNAVYNFLVYIINYINYTLYTAAYFPYERFFSKKRQS
ncbi:hypothetical protein HS7_12880 [Sulfolobales archaeon HS-7]|nr:hypothetical protein HS7_12880 [Sulfolobales archaeon HS-7]